MIFFHFLEIHNTVAWNCQPNTPLNGCDYLYILVRTFTTRSNWPWRLQPGPGRERKAAYLQRKNWVMTSACKCVIWAQTVTSWPSLALICVATYLHNKRDNKAFHLTHTNWRQWRIFWVASQQQIKLASAWNSAWRLAHLCTEKHVTKMHAKMTR